MGREIKRMPLGSTTMPNRYTCLNPGACDCGRAEGEFCRHWGEPSAATALDVRTERDTAIGLGDGWRGEVVRVKYRKPPTRRWTTFLLVPDDGQTIEELEANATDAAILHAAKVGAR